eukprot:jgi/Botrbrau1/3323/Bobra.0048s0019.2
MMGSLTGSRCAGIVKDASVAPSLRRTPTLCIAGVRRINLSHSTSRKQAPLFRVSAGEAPLSRGQLQVANSMVEKLTAQELEQGLQDRTMPLIIDFYATWCGPCLLLAKELDEVLPSFGRPQDIFFAGSSMVHKLRAITVDHVRAGVVPSLHPNLRAGRGL